MSHDNQLNPVHLSIDEVENLAVGCLARNGFDDANASAIAATVTAAERDGCPSHGLFRIPGYVVTLKTGRAKPTAKPRLTDNGGAVLRMDADSGFAPLALQIGYGPLAEAARKHGIASLAIANSFHLAALWPEAEAMAEHGLAGFAFTSSRAFVAPAGGTKPLYGTNPMAFAWPRPGKAPLVFDQASSAMARGEVQLALRAGEQVGEGVGIDSNGNPTTDPQSILAGAQLAFGGYKGGSIAMLVELLAGPLLGQSLSIEAHENTPVDEGGTLGGELLIALDPKHFGDADGWADHAEVLFSHIGQQDGARLPGERRLANRERITREGTSIPQSLHDKLLELRGT